MNAFNDDRHDDTDEISLMLNELPRVEPPPDVVGTVMSTISQVAQSHATHPPVNNMRRGSTMAKKVLWSVAAAAAAALVVMRVAGYPPVEKGTEATIGAAQRYQAPQVAAADVKVQDQDLQAFLQSDLFRQLVADKAAIEALKNKDLRQALTQENVRAVLARPEVQQIVAHVQIDAAARVVSLDAAKLGVKFDAAKLDAAKVALESAIQVSPSLAYALAVPKVAEAVASSSLAAVLAAPKAALLVSQQVAFDAVMTAAFDAAPSAGGVVAH